MLERSSWAYSATPSTLYCPCWSCTRARNWLCWVWFLWFL